MKKLVIILLFACNGFMGFSQVTEAEQSLKTHSTDSIENWKFGGVFNIGLSQTSLTNWSAGGQSSIAFNGLVSINLQYKKGKNLWENCLDLGYGQQWLDDETGWHKTDDKIDFTTKYGYELHKSIYLTTLVNFKSQFDKGYNYPNDSVVISKFMAPGYILGAIGLEYKPNNIVSVFLAPVTAKITIVNDQALSDSGAFGVTPGEASYTAFGGYLRLALNKDIMKNVNLQTKFDLFSNYLDKPQNMDVSWETLLSLKVNKYLSATILAHLIYDENVVKKTQFKEILSVGFSYTL
jgi:hypothetical protein